MWFDTHAHIDSDRFAGEQDLLVERARQAGVTRFVNVGCDRDSILRTLAYVDRYEGVYGAIGLHPHDASSFSDELLEDIRIWAVHPKIVAIGELGLDSTMIIRQGTSSVK